MSYWIESQMDLVIVLVMLSLTCIYGFGTYPNIIIIQKITLRNFLVRYMFSPTLNICDKYILIDSLVAITVKHKEEYNKNIGFY